MNINIKIGNTTYSQANTGNWFPEGSSKSTYSHAIGSEAMKLLLQTGAAQKVKHSYIMEESWLKHLIAYSRYLDWEPSKIIDLFLETYGIKPITRK